MVNPARQATRSFGEVLEKRARAGDREAAFELLAGCRDRVRGFCRGYLRNDHDAEDAAQEVIAKIAAAPWPAGSFRSWLYRVARNQCLVQLRRAPGVDGFRPSQVVSHRTGPGTAVDRRDRDQKVAAAMDSLTRAHAEVLFLRYFEDLSRSEIAAVLNLSESAVKGRLWKARCELAARLELPGSGVR